MGNRKISFFGNLVKMSVGIGNMEKRLIGEKKVQSSEGIDRITIYPSNVDLEITASESSDIEIGLYAYVDTNAKVILETKHEKGEYIVTSRINNDNFYGNIILNVAIPSKKKFNQIKVDGKSSDVDFVDFISVNGIDVTTCSGDVTIQKVSATEGIQVLNSILPKVNALKLIKMYRQVSFKLKLKKVTLKLKISLLRFQPTSNLLQVMWN